jgi:ankyrin repeat protein
MAVNGLDADLFDAVEFGDREFAEVLLDDPSVNVNAQDLEGTTILMLASHYGHKDLVQLILRRGADPNLQDKQGRTALRRATESGDKEVAELLKQGGAV